MRIHSLLLADELRQSSDDLTRMVRTYAVTGDPVYKQHFQNILDIRNGKKSRPEEYWRVYWDLVLPGSPVPRPQSRQSISLLNLMRQAGFTKDEFLKLEEANANSDRLTTPEFEAMKLIESLGPESKASREKAIQMLHDKAYHEAKYGIMKPIDECIEMIDRRTSAAVKNADYHTGILLWIFIAFGLGLVLMLFRTYTALSETLGDSLDNVYLQIRKIGAGDFSSSIEMKNLMENSVMGWLLQTQTKLRAYSDESKKAREELAQAFKAETKNREILTSMLDDNNQVRQKLEKSLENLKLSQDKFIQSEKLASLGRLISDISHEVNNPLMIISANAQFAIMSGSVSDKLKDKLELIVKECQRAADIIHRTLKFAKPSKGEAKEVKIGDSLEAVVNIVKMQFEMAKVNIERNYPNIPVIISVDNQLIQEVFMNILNNAKEAMPDGGTIAIIVSLEGDFVRIDFKDTGCGISEDDKKRLFEPFFTTKEKGTGLGLSICYGIIKAHNGEIRLESQFNKGATVTVLLPLKGAKI
ncbi:MAG: ATP-binding protein [Candidatus Omnitrophota bacterium]